jgi:SAM-dependent methyltransferase
MGFVVSVLDRHFYPGVVGGWDHWLLRDEVLRHMRPEHTMLDLGAGSGRLEAMHFRGLTAKVCGIDPDPIVLQNPHLDEAKQAFGESIPYGDETFDIVFSANVLEHLTNPLPVFKEVARVLRPGGVFVVKTPNKLHYMATVARLTPLRFHRFYTGLMGRAAIDTFPTVYKANTSRTIARLAASAGLSCEARLFESRPEYLRVFALTYPFGIVYERLVNRFSWLSPFRIVIVATMTKGMPCSHTPTVTAPSTPPD